MKFTDLKPIHDKVASGGNVRRVAATAINAALLSPVAANRTALAAFFADCGDKASGAAAGTRAVVTSGVNIVVPVTGTYVTKATPTIVGGVITAIVLS